MTPHSLEPGPRSHGTSGRACWTSTMGPSLPGQLLDPERHCMPSEPSTSPPGVRVDPAGPRTLVKVARVSWSTHWSLGHGSEWPRRSGKPRGPRTRAQDARDSWSTLRDLGPERESSRTAGRHRGSSETGPSRPVQLVDSAGHWSLAHVAQEFGSTLRALEPWPESPGSAGPPPRTSDQSPSRLGSWSTLRAIGAGSVSPGIVGRPRRTSDLGLSGLGKVVDPAGHSTRA